MNDQSAFEDPVGRIADRFVEEFRQGKRPSVEDYAKRYPDHAEQLREILPALVLMEKAKSNDAPSSDAGAPVAAPPTEADALELRELGDFRILRELGQGGMGVVYEAEQVSLGRHVALKVLPGKMLRDAKARRRFEREAKAAAKLHHTNIVPVFGVGEHDGLPYYVMQFIQGLGVDVVMEELKRLKDGGGNLAQGSRSSRSGRSAAREVSAVGMARSLLTGEFHRNSDADELIAVRTEAGNQSLSPLPESRSASSQTQALSSGSIILPGQSGTSHSSQTRKANYWQSVAHLGMQVADALDYAHKQNIVHRDIKPSNLLLDLQGTAWITDFGLAKADDHQNLTHTGDILGTLRYMPPEAFDGKADGRGDVYALGLTLYEMLAFQPAFDESDRAKLIKQVTNAEPTRLRKLNRQVPRDLETIVHKAIDRDPARRYPTAGEFAADLQRFLADEPIRARRTSSAERLVRWSRRNKALAGALGVVAMLLVAITLGSIGLAAYFRHQEANQRNLVKAKDELLEQNGKLIDENQLAREIAEAALLEAEATLVDMQTSRGLLAGERDDAGLAVLWFARAAEQARSDPQQQADNRLRARNWARQAVLPVRALPFLGDARSMEFRPGGDLLMVLGPTLYVWDWRQDKVLPWATGKRNVSAACWSPDGAYLALGHPSGQVEVLQVSDGAILHQLRHVGGITALTFSPDGHHLAIASNVVRIWDMQTQAFLRPEWKHPSLVDSVLFNRKGDRLVTSCMDKQARVFAVGGDPEQPAPLFGPVAHGPFHPSPPAFLDEDRALVTISADRQLSWWDLDQGTPARRTVISTTPNRLARVLASPRGDWFVTGGDSTAQVWSTANRGKSWHLLDHNNRVHDLAWSPDGKVLLTVSWDQTARLWAFPEGRLLGAPLPHMGDVKRCAFSTEGLYLATAANGLIRIWQRPALDLAMPEIAGWGQRPRLSLDGRRLAPGAWYETPFTTSSLGVKYLVVRDAMTGKPSGPPIPVEGLLVDSCITADNTCVAAVSLDGSTGWMGVFDVATGQSRFDLQKLPSAPLSVAARPRSDQIAVLCPGQLLVFDSRTGEVVFNLAQEEWHGNIGRCPRVEYTRDGATLVTLAGNSTIQVRDAATGQHRYPPIRPVLKMGPCRSIALSADGRLLATAVNGYNAAQVWDLATGRPLSQPLLHPGDSYGLFHICFSPDGQRLLTGCKDGQARLWDWKSGQLACPPLKHHDEVLAVAITPDGRHAVTTCRGPDAGLQVWELTTGKLVGPPIQLTPRRSAASTMAYFALSPDGQRAFAGIDGRKSLTVINLADLLIQPEMTTADLRLLGELASAQRIDLGDVNGLAREQWLDGMNRFRQKQPAFGLPPITEAIAQHQQAAQVLSDSGQPMAALAHLRQALIETSPVESKDPQWRSLRTAIYCQRAELLRILGRTEAANDDLKQARTVSEQLVAEQPASAEAAGRLAAVLLEERRATAWAVLQPAEMKSTSGATLTLLADHSILLSGKIAPNDSYTVVARTDLKGITALRLEVLPDYRLPNHGPGRFGNGNFCLTEIALAIAPADTPDQLQSIGFTQATGYKRAIDNVTTPQDGPQGAIDGNHATRWDIGHREGQANTAYFATTRPFGGDGRTTLNVRLDFQDPIWKQHVLGRFRLSVTTRAHPVRDENLILLAEGGNGWTRLGVNLILREEWPQALAALQKAVAATAGGSAREHFLLALVHEQLGQPTEAAQDLERVVAWMANNQVEPLLPEMILEKLAPRVDGDPRNPGWLLLRARCYGKLGRIVEAAADLDRALELKADLAFGPADSSLLDTLANAAARRGQWQKAGDYFTSALNTDTKDEFTWYRAGALFVYLGDAKTYRRHYQVMLERYGSTKDPAVARRTAKGCLVLADGIDNLENLNGLLQTARSAGEKDGSQRYLLMVLGLHAYRTGRNLDALTACRESRRLNAQGDLYLTAHDHTIEAMAQHRLGKSDEAKASLASAKQLMDQRFPKLESGDLGPAWNNWLVAKVLYREAELVIADKKDKPKE